MSRIRNKAHEFLGAYERMNAFFEEKFGYSLYFIGGTLLGFVRENDFLANDKDMDVSYFSKYDNVADVRKELIDIVHTLIDSGEDLYFVRADYTIVKNYLRWRVDARDRIDVMPTWCQDGHVCRPTFVGYEGSKDIILPLKKEKFYGHDVFIPNQPEIKLANVYGEDWRIPNPAFKKRERKNDFTNRVVSTQLCYADTQWNIIKQTSQWKAFSFLEKLYVHLLYARRHKILSYIIPDKTWFQKEGFKRLRDFFRSKKAR